MQEHLCRFSHLRLWQSQSVSPPSSPLSSIGDIRIAPFKPPHSWGNDPRKFPVGSKIARTDVIYTRCSFWTRVSVATKDIHVGYKADQSSESTPIPKAKIRFPGPSCVIISKVPAVYILLSSNLKVSSEYK